MNVDLDKVKEIINSVLNHNIMYYPIHIKDKSHYSAGITDAKKAVLEKLDQLAYGKIYKCLNCGKDICFVSFKDDSCKTNYYMHVDSRAIRCEKNTGLKYTSGDIAIPTPESLGGQETMSNKSYLGKTHPTSTHISGDTDMKVPNR